MVLVNCLNMTCQNAARMTMLEKGRCLQWHPLVYSDLPSIVRRRSVMYLMQWGVRFPGKSRRKGVQFKFNVISNTKGWVGVNFSEKCFGAIQVLRNAFP